MTISLTKKINKGVSFLQEGKLEKAEKQFQEVLKMQANNADGQHLLGVLRHEQGRITESIELLEKAVVQDSNNLVFLGNLSNSLITDRQLLRAEETCLRILQLDSSYEPAYYHLARINFLTQRPQQAIEYCQHSLQYNSENSVVQFFLAQLYVEQELWHEALIIYQLLLDQYPEQAEVHYGLALVKQGLGELESALSYYRKALAINPQMSEAYNGLGGVYFTQGELTKAYSLFYQALKKNPENVEALYNQGLVLRNMGRLDEAVVVLLQAITVNPQHISALASYALTLQELGKLSEAKVVYEQVLKLDTEHSLALHMLCAIQGQNSEKAPEKFVTDLFDVYAPAYEQHLQNELGFRAPTIISQVIEAQCKNFLPFEKVLDLGCGTGLMGQKIISYSREIDGVDLAENMLSLAKDKNIYRNLIHQEIDSFLKEEALINNKKYDCCIASDVFIYFGDLQNTFAAVHTILNKNGTFIFTTETSLDGKFQLLKTGRYAHSEAYISELALMCGFKLRQQNSVKLRKEDGDWLLTHVSLLQK